MTYAEYVETVAANLGCEPEHLNHIDLHGPFTSGVCPINLSQQIISREQGV
jgi:hypothetical protein